MKLPMLKYPMSAALLIATSIFASIAFSGCYQVGDAVNDAVRDIKMTPTSQPVTKSTQGSAPTVEQLSRYEFTLVNAEKQGATTESLASVIASGAGKLSFTNNRINYSVGCNRVFGAYKLDGAKLAIGGLASTQMACQDLAQAEAKLGSWMTDSQLAIEVHADDTATLTQSKGAEVLTWQGKLTHKARFGEPVTLFWEVDPTKTDCVDKSGKDQLCLRVRNINYDDRGIKVGSGAWRTFYGNIEGFEHNPELRQIIRLHAYNNPNGEPNPYYVYDMTVMSEIVK